MAVDNAGTVDASTSADHNSQSADAGAQAAENEYEDAFAEFAGAAEAQKEPGEDPAPGDKAKTAEEIAAEEAAAAAPAAAEAPKAEDKPAGQTAEDRAAIDAAQDSLNKLKKSIGENPTDEQRTALDAVQNDLHRARSGLGRIPGYERRIHNLETELASARVGKFEKPGATPAAKISDDPVIKKMLEDLPENSPLVAIMERLDRNQQQLGSALSDMTERDRANAIRAEQSAFDTAHPDFLKDHRKTFTAWVRTKPKSIQDIAVRNGGETIVNAEESIALVDLFKLESGIATEKKPAAEKQQQQPPSAPPQSGDRRKAQLEAARSSPAQKGPDPAKAGATDFDTAFDEFAAKAERKRK